MKNVKKTDKPRVSLDDLAERAANDEGAFDTELYDPLDASAKLDVGRAMPGVVRRAHMNEERN